MIKVKKVIDLSHPLTNHTQVYPGDPQPNITVATTIAEEGYNLFRVVLGSQTGSHVDAPYHFKEDGMTIDKIDLQLCMGKAVVIDVSYKGPKESITLADIQRYEDKIEKGDIILFRTDWYKKETTEAFYNHPYLAEESGRYLLEQGIKTVGIDAINLDNTGGTYFPIHDMYAKAGGLIAENLAHFDQIDFKDPFVIFLPLKLIGCDGSPVRAVAVELVWEETK